MQLVIIHNGNQGSRGGANGLLRFALSSRPCADAILEGLARWPWPACNPGRTLIAIPKDWGQEVFTEKDRIIFYMDNVPVPLRTLRKAGREEWTCIFNGRYITKLDNKLLVKMLTVLRADLVAVNVTRELMAYNEKARITSQGKLVGFSRLYSDSFEPVPMPDDWPHCVFIRTDCLERVLNGEGLPEYFPAFLAGCKLSSLKMVSVKAGGEVIDLETEGGLLGFCNAIVGSVVTVSDKRTKMYLAGAGQYNFSSDSSNPLLFGRVLLGENVQIGDKVVIAGPAIIGDNVKVERGAVVTSSIIGPCQSVPEGQVIQDKVLRGSEFSRSRVADRTEAGDFRQGLCHNNNVISRQSRNGAFRIWPGFSYAGFFKRVADIIFAGIALLLFAPFFPIIAAAIKLSSKGPLFFIDRRQGLHGREFKCIKFRTMMVGADDMQDKLRSLNQVDGPQFKMDDDPRVSSVGRFLRATYIDEVPQFINVLLGQMSVIGPRPSPESENELCPFWRYARLSVRPGITGLWQVFGTREPLKDFQEWIHYDVKYVKELSLRLDLWLCYKTVKKILKLFVNQL